MTHTFRSRDPGGLGFQSAATVGRLGTAADDNIAFEDLIVVVCSRERSRHPSCHSSFSCF